MSTRRSILLKAVSTAAATWAAAPAVRAQGFPSLKPIRLVVSGPVASALDLVARALADGMESSMGQRVVVENKPTANGALAGADVARSAPDGYSLLVTATSSMVINPHLNSSLGWNPVRDFAPVAEIGTTATVVAVNAQSPLRTFGDALAAARAKPGQVKWGLLNLTLSHFIGLALKEDAQADFSLIPFSQQAQMVTALVSGDVDLISTGVGSLLQFFESGRMRPLVTTSDQRLENLPAVPTLAEFVPGFSAPNWISLFGPAGLGAGVVARLNQVVNTLNGQPAFREKMKVLGTVPTVASADMVQQRVRTDFDRYKAIVSRSGLKV